MARRKQALLLAWTLGLGVGVSTWAEPAAALPKLDIKVFAGGGIASFIPRVQGERYPTKVYTWQGGFGGRVRDGHLFAGADIVFQRFLLRFADHADEIDPELIAASPQILGVNLTMHSLAIPLIAGYVPYTNPFFKLYLYGGLVNHFNVRGFITLGGQTKIVKPKDIEFAPYIAGARLGTQFDLAMFNFDFNYTINMNSATSTDYRTNVHRFQGNLGWLF